MDVSPDDMWTLLLSTVRYSLGRSTYMTAYSVGMVVKYEACLETYQLRQISKEIRDEIEQYEAAGRRIPDYSTWRQGAQEIDRLAGKRE
jgi:hypothetical protein